MFGRRFFFTTKFSMTNEWNTRNRSVTRSVTAVLQLSINWLKLFRVRQFEKSRRNSRMHFRYVDRSEGGDGSQVRLERSVVPPTKDDSLPDHLSLATSHEPARARPVFQRPGDSEGSRIGTSFTRSDKPGANNARRFEARPSETLFRVLWWRCKTTAESRRNRKRNSSGQPK